MKVFRLHGASNANMTFVIKDENDLYRGELATSEHMTELLWQQPPELVLRSAEINQRKYKGQKQKVPDIGHFITGSLIFSTKAHQLLKEYFEKFGEFSVIQIEGETWFNYYVTNILTGIVDVQNSTFSRKGKMMIQPAFIAENLPKDCQIFKVPEMQLVDIYFNDSGVGSIMSAIEQLGFEAGDAPLVWESK